MNGAEVMNHLFTMRQRSREGMSKLARHQSIPAEISGQSDDARELKEKSQGGRRASGSSFLPTAKRFSSIIFGSQRKT